MSDNVVQFPAQDIEDVAWQLRSLADDMEAGRVEVPETCTVVLSSDDGAVGVHICGAEAESNHGLAALAKGQHILLSSIMPFGANLTDA